MDYITQHHRFLLILKGERISYWLHIPTEMAASFLVSNGAGVRYGSFGLIFLVLLVVTTNRNICAQGAPLNATNFHVPGCTIDQLETSLMLVIQKINFRVIHKWPHFLPRRYLVQPHSSPYPRYYGICIAPLFRKQWPWPCSVPAVADSRQPIWLLRAYSTNVKGTLFAESIFMVPDSQSNA